MDIVMITVTDVKMAAEISHQLDPWIIIPMGYEQVEEFLKEMGASVSPIQKLTMSKDKLPQETQVVVLERK